MFVECERCGDRFDDEYVSTVCPHEGIGGLCRKCDSYICYSPNEHRRANVADEFLNSQEMIPADA
jgi:hypothetical protein